MGMGGYGADRTIFGVKLLVAIRSFVGKATRFHTGGKFASSLTLARHKFGIP